MRNLAECFLADESFMGQFTAAPAGVKHHHAYHGCLLQHVVSLMEVVTVVAPRYPELDADLLLMGAFLHDVGGLFAARQLATSCTIVVLHDPTLDRTTNGSGPVCQQDWTDVARLDAGYHFSRDGRELGCCTAEQHGVRERPARRAARRGRGAPAGSAGPEPARRDPP